MTAVAPAAPAVAKTVGRRWWVLAALMACQLMLMLDVTIVNVALPATQADLAISESGRQWVVTSYAVTFGGFLLLGGRIADRIGRRRSLVIALAGFAGASALGGAAWSDEALFAARALQGLFGALLAPAVLSSISLLFPSGPERSRAFAVYGAVSAAGGAVGYLVGGALTDVLSWRWCLLVNTPLALLTAAALLWLLTGDRERRKGGMDVAGAVLATIASSTLVFGLARAADDGWGAPVPLASLGVAAVLTVAFLLLEARVRDPLLPLEIIRHRVRAAAFLVILCAFGANTGLMLLLVLHLQGPMEMSAFEAGLAFAPIMVSAAAASALAAQIVSRVAARTLMAAGAAMSVGSLLMLSGLDADSAYATGVLPAFCVSGFGMALIFVPATSLAMHELAAADEGAASGGFTAVQQIGAAAGVALVNTAAVSAMSGRLAELGPAGAADAALHGQSVGLAVAAGLMLVAAFAALLAGRVRAAPPAPGAHGL